jgi:hypothetical protein
LEPILKNLLRQIPVKQIDAVKEKMQYLEDLKKSMNENDEIKL